MPSKMTRRGRGRPKDDEVEADLVEDVEANTTTKQGSKGNLFARGLAGIGKGLSSRGLDSSENNDHSGNKGASTRALWRDAPPSPNKGGSSRPGLDQQQQGSGSNRGVSARNLWRGDSKKNLSDNDRQDSSKRRNIWKSDSAKRNDESSSRGISSRNLWRGTPASPKKGGEREESWSESETSVGESEDWYRDELDKALLEQIDKEDTEVKGDFDPNSRWATCLGRFCYEISPWQNWFLVEAPPYTQRTIDVPASFAPTGPLPVIGKILSLMSGIVVLVWTFMVEKNKLFCLAYLSTWNNIYFLVYMVCSVLNTMQGVSQPFSRVGGTVRVAWLFFAITAQTGILEAIMYWGTEVDYGAEDGVDTNFRVLMLHGGLTLEAILDGFTVNVIPLRWQQWWGCCLLPNILYVGWTLIHGFFLWVGNPNEADRNTIYKIISWRYAWKDTLMWMLIAVFVISPVVYGALWMMSLYKWFCCCCWRRERRRYLQTTNNMEKYREMAQQHMEDAMAKAEERLAKDRERAEKKAARRAARRKAKQSDTEDDDDGDDVERGQASRLFFFNRSKNNDTKTKGSKELRD
mmetsp:Transcript_24445/g.57349  ORF Transcript_24445/g.57349 Transcript_24445/m.57349 type:complete len:576 (+) Transcript_24445:134-1861(+)